MSGLLAKIQGKQGPAQQEQPSHTEADGNERSLMTVFTTHEDRASFLLLVADCIQAMRQDLTNTFDAQDTGTSQLSKEEITQLNPDEDDDDEPKDDSKVEKVESTDEIDLTNEDPEDEHSQARAAIKEAESEQQLAKAEAAAKAKAEQEHQRRLKLLSSKDVTDLRDAAYSHFDEWRDRVMERIGEAVNAHGPDEEAEEKKSKLSPKPQSDDAQDKTPDDRAVQAHFTPVNTPLTSLNEPERILVLHSVLLLLLSLEQYTAQSRVLLLHVASSLNVPVEYLITDESKVAQGLIEAAKASMNADEETKKKAEKNVWSRRIKIGLGATAGAVLIGVTGGLAAPLLAAGVGAAMGGLGLGATVTATYLGAIVGSAPLIGALFGAYGGRMAGNMIDNYSKEVSDFAFLPIQKSGIFSRTSAADIPAADRRLKVSIGISGWLNDANDVTKPWQVIGHKSSEVFALRWELEALLSLGSALRTLVTSLAWGLGTKAVVSTTVFATLAAGLWPLTIVKVARLVDNPFSVAKNLSEKVGQVLADALINKVQGERPVTLVGYSLGARVIYACLEELARRRAFGLVESVVLAGAPVPADFLAWRRMRSVVSGRVVNVFSTNDYLLAFLYRTSSLQYGIAGLQPIAGVKGVENVDVSDTVNGHTTYRFLMGKVLQKLGFEDVDDAAVEAEEKALKAEQEKDEAERRKKEAEADGEDVEALEAEAEKRKKAGVVGWVGEKMSFMSLGGKKDEGKNMTEEERVMKRQMDMMNREIDQASASGKAPA